MKNAQYLGIKNELFLGIKNELFYYTEWLIEKDIILLPKPIETKDISDTLVDGYIKEKHPVDYVNFYNLVSDEPSNWLKKAKRRKQWRWMINIINYFKIKYLIYKHIK